MNLLPYLAALLCVSFIVALVREWMAGDGIRKVTLAGAGTAGAGYFLTWNSPDVAEQADAHLTLSAWVLVLGAGLTVLAPLLLVAATLKVHEWVLHHELIELYPQQRSQLRLQMRLWRLSKNERELLDVLVADSGVADEARYRRTPVPELQGRIESMIRAARRLS